MPATSFDVSAAQRWFAIEANNAAWDLYEKSPRTAEETAAMVSAALAARWHWGAIGTPLNLLRAETLVAAAYLAAGEAGLAKAHAWRGVPLAQDAATGATLFDRACLHAVLARALDALEQRSSACEHAAAAQALVAQFDDPDDKRVFEKLFPESR